MSFCNTFSHDDAVSIYEYNNATIYIPTCQDVVRLVVQQIHNKSKQVEVGPSAQDVCL